MKKQIHLKRVLATYWNDVEDHSKGYEQLEHIFVSIDKESWQEINYKILTDDITMDYYDETKELFDNPSIKINESFFKIHSNLFINYKNRKIPKMEILEEKTVK